MDDRQVPVYKSMRLKARGGRRRLLHHFGCTFMRRQTSLLATLALLAGISLSIVAEDQQSGPSPAPLTVIGPPLIAWSDLQKPQPILVPVPDPASQEPDKRAVQPVRLPQANAQDTRDPLLKRGK